MGSSWLHAKWRLNNSLAGVQYALYFDAWRWCIFLACFVPIYWVSRFIVHLLVVIVEAKLFSNAKVLYFMVSVRVRCLHLVAPHLVVCRGLQT